MISPTLSRLFPRQPTEPGWAYLSRLERKREEILGTILAVAVVVVPMTAIVLLAVFAR